MQAELDAQLEESSTRVTESSGELVFSEDEENVRLRSNSESAVGIWTWAI